MVSWLVCTIWSQIPDIPASNCFGTDYCASFHHFSLNLFGGTRWRVSDHRTNKALFPIVGSLWSATPFSVFENTFIMAFHDCVVHSCLLTFILFAIWRAENFNLLQVTIWAYFPHFWFMNSGNFTKKVFLQTMHLAGNETTLSYGDSALTQQHNCAVWLCNADYWSKYEQSKLNSFCFWEVFPNVCHRLYMENNFWKISNIFKYCLSKRIL